MHKRTKEEREAASITQYSVLVLPFRLRFTVSTFGHSARKAARSSLALRSAFVFPSNYGQSEFVSASCPNNLCNCGGPATHTAHLRSTHDREKYQTVFLGSRLGVLRRLGAELSPQVSYYASDDVARTKMARDDLTVPNRTSPPSAGALSLRRDPPRNANENEQRAMKPKMAAATAERKKWPSIRRSHRAATKSSPFSARKRSFSESASCGTRHSLDSHIQVPRSRLTFAACDHLPIVVHRRPNSCSARARARREEIKRESCDVDV